MANIVTPDFRARNSTSFVDEVISNTYYTFVSSMEETETLNSEYSKREFLEKTLFGKKVLEQDVYYMVKNNRCTPGIAYDAYDDKSDLTNKSFFVTVYPQDQETGDYYVFKCLSNNYGAPASDNLVYSPIPNQIYNTTNDGYTWKYLYTITNFNFRTLATNNLIPIIEDPEAANSAVDGIESILITNPGESSGYTTFSGKITEVVTSSGNIDTLVIAGLNGAEVSQVADYYAGQSITITKGFGDDAATELYTVVFWEATGQTTGNIKLQETVAAGFIDDTCTIKIVPRIEILGNGTGAKAIPVINDTSGTITSIQMLDIGEGYTNAVARVVDPNTDFQVRVENNNSNRCLIRPIISPPNGHNSNLKEELLSRDVLINTEISITDNNTIPTSRTYTKIGLVKNPEFSAQYIISEDTVFDNRLRITLDSVTGINVDDILFQVDPADPTTEIKIFEGKVHTISGNDIYLINYMGPYQNFSTSDISFDPSQPLRNNIGQLFPIATNTFTSLPDVTQSPYEQTTGEVFYINTFNPIERTPFSLEQYKILLQF